MHKKEFEKMLKLHENWIMSLKINDRVDSCAGDNIEIKRFEDKYYPNIPDFIYTILYYSLPKKLYEKVCVVVETAFIKVGLVRWYDRNFYFDGNKTCSGMHCVFPVGTDFNSDDNNVEDCDLDGLL